MQKLTREQVYFQNLKKVEKTIAKLRKEFGEDKNKVQTEAGLQDIALRQVFKDKEELKQFLVIRAERRRLRSLGYRA